MPLKAFYSRKIGFIEQKWVFNIAERVKLEKVY